MDASIIVASIAGAVSLTTAALGITERARTSRITTELYESQKKLEAELVRQTEAFKAELAQRARAEERANERERVVSRFRNPLARSAYDLQSRIWNILGHHFLAAYRHVGERERRYAIQNTAYVIAQYFAWVEIIRREIDYVDLGVDENTRRLAHLQDEITKMWGEDDTRYGEHLRIWAGEQRAIGELLISETARGSQVLGYGAFLKLLEERPSPLMEYLIEQVTEIADTSPAANRRLVEVQHALIDLLDHLDPNDLLFPRHYRSKVDRDGRLE